MLRGYGRDVSHWFGAMWPGANSSPGPRVFCGAASLVFLAYPIADLTTGDPGGAAAIAAGAGLAAFAAFYLRLFWILPWVADERRAEALTLLGAIAALTIVLASARDEWVGLIVYLSVTAALTLPMRFAVGGVIAAGVIAAAMVGADESVVLQALMFGLLILAVRRLSGLVEELEEARARVAELAVSEERLRLSRDLHDLLGHNLSVIALKGELARRLIERDAPAAAAKEMRDVEAVARDSLQEAREAVRGLRRGSLGAELRRACDALEAADIEPSVHIDGSLPEELEGILAFAVREATTNVIRHSRAQTCALTVRHARGNAELEVRDDGTGEAAVSGDGSGLRGLTERLAEVGGTLETSSAPGGGFQLLASIPMSRTATAR